MRFHFMVDLTEMQSGRDTLFFLGDKFFFFFVENRVAGPHCFALLNASCNSEHISLLLS